MATFLINVPSPVGPWGVSGTEDVVTAIYLPRQPHAATDGPAPRVLNDAATQLREYFDGQRRHFEKPRAPVEATSFQSAVWAALTAIPFGEVRTYGEVAESVGRPRAFRAVGNANHVNPYPVLVPCHRVVATTGLGGYGGGDEVKRFLLALEGAHY